MKIAEVFEMQKLLLLEDDASLIDGLAYSLKKNGFDIEIARNFCEAEILLTRIKDLDRKSVV